MYIQCIPQFCISYNYPTIVGARSNINSINRIKCYSLNTYVIIRFRSMNECVSKENYTCSKILQLNRHS